MEGGGEDRPKMAELKPEDAGENEVGIKVEEPVAVPPPVVQEKLQFTDIPLDIKRLIFSYITLPSDLKSLCLTNKELREIATPILYRTVELCVGGPKDMRLSAGLLSPTNPGLRHIRRLYTDIEKIVVRKSSPDSDESSGEEEEFEDVGLAIRQANFTIRLLLDVIPANTLESFRWNAWTRLSVDNCVLLWKKQKRLKIVEIDATDHPLMPILEKDPNLIKDFVGVPELSLYPDSLDTLQVCQKLLQANPGVKELTLCATAFKRSGERVPEDLQDSSTRPGLFSRTLFSHMQPFETCSSPFMLTYLRLDHLSLRYAASSYLRVIKFSTLKTLEVYKCSGVENLFAQLSKPHIRPGQLKHLDWVQNRINEPHILEAFEGLLESLLGLESLHVEIDSVNNLPKAKAITHHGKTLKYLCICGQTNDYTHTYEPADFMEICQNCPGLAQLSVAFPATSVDTADDSPYYATFLTSMKKLRDLRTLVMDRWPSWCSTEENLYIINSRGKIKPRRFELYKYKLRRLVQNIFEISDRHAKEMNWGLGNRSMLSVVAVGSSSTLMVEGSQSAKLEQVHYVRGQQIDAFGKRSMMAVNVSKHLVRFIEPESGILDLIDSGP